MDNNCTWHLDVSCMVWSYQHVSDDCTHVLGFVVEVHPEAWDAYRHYTKGHYIGMVFGSAGRPVVVTKGHSLSYTQGAVEGRIRAEQA